VRARAAITTLLTGALAASAATATQRSALEPPLPPAPPAASARLGLDARVLLGVVEAPYVAPLFPRLQAHGILLRLASSYQLDPAWSVGVGLPLALFSLRQPAGSYLDEAALGNPHASLTREHDIPAGTLRLRGWVRLRVGIPLAERGPAGSLMNGRALEAAHALDAYREVESFAAGTWPIVPGAGVGLDSGRYRALGTLDVPWLVRFSDAGLPADADERAFGWYARLRLEGAARLASWFQARLATDAVLALLPVARALPQPSPLQLSVNPGVEFNLGRRVALGIEVVVPLGGPLGGSLYSGGSRLRTAW
jgi:hypothetical protein